MKVYIVSLPYNKPNSGDFDYCQQLSQYLSKEEDVEAEYITQETLQFTETLETPTFKKGENFYALYEENWLQDKKRQRVAKKLIDYIIDDVFPGQKVLNLQLRPPESGFLLSANDLQNLKDVGTFVCVTCHEYKLNYSRRWLQAILHAYFEKAHMCLFFNEKDRKNATKHANRSIFWDEKRDDLGENSFDQLLRGFHSKENSSNKIFHIPETNDIIVYNETCSMLKCDYFVGEINSKQSLDWQEGDNHYRSSGQIEMSWGLRKNLLIAETIPRQEFNVSGFLINAKVENSIGETCPKTGLHEFDFSHEAYDLAPKCDMTKVFSTVNTELFDVDDSLKKKPNIIVFGLIREGKGFEFVCDLIKNAMQIGFQGRLLIVGNVDSDSVLLRLLETKFDTQSLSIDDIQPENFENTVKRIKNKRKDKIKSQLDPSWRTNDLEEHIFGASLAEQEKDRKILREKLLQSLDTNNPSHKLQRIIWRLEEKIPDAIKIDLYLDVPKEHLKDIFNEALYAVKIDEKGWANNASSLINILSFGCVLYASWGMCTPKPEMMFSQILKEPFILPKGKYGLSEGERLKRLDEGVYKRMHTYKRKDPKSKKPQGLRNLIEVKDILNDIMARDKGEKIQGHQVLMSSGDNKQTLTAALEFLKRDFQPQTIVNNMVKQIRRRIHNT